MNFNTTTKKAVLISGVIIAVVLIISGSYIMTRTETSPVLETTGEVAANINVENVAANTNVAASNTNVVADTNVVTANTNVENVVAAINPVVIEQPMLK